MKEAVRIALSQPAVDTDQLTGAGGFGVSGYDWPSEKEPTLRALAELGIDFARLEMVNDTIWASWPGRAEGWGVALVSGTGCNCRGWDG